ncbi:MAG: aminotransferase class V-fold PLP-dependent enzyme, partial [bacterium]|nr:aminotransferase class V-fold PLP-dependent enzyme [bacterium]
MLNPQDLKKDFPILSRQINGKSLVYLDNASTTQKPRQVIEALTKFYETANANIHRGVHTLSEEATENYENTRKHTAKFINAKSEKEIVFTKNTTESINLVAQSWGNTNIGKNDEIIVSALEHHSNLVPWQELCRVKKAKLRIIPLKSDYTLDQTKYKNLLSPNTKLVALSGMSNVLGTTPPIKEMTKQAHKVGAKVLIDGAQYVAHRPTDVIDLDCDFL